MIIYEINCTNCEYKTLYGINVLQNGLIVKSINCITHSKTDMQKLCDMCNKLKLEICHLDDIIEDYLTDFEI
ncbi:MAG: DUF6514 family protein [Ruminococcus sp.]|nr:DUF6514 family protein [Ruminococcus sp.]